MKFVLILVFINYLVKSTFITNDYTFAIQPINTTAAKFIFTSIKVGWVGVGFGSNSMKRCDYVIVKFLSQSTYSLLDTYSNSRDFPNEDSTLGGSQDYNNCQYSYNSGNYTLICERLLNTGDKYDYQFKIPSTNIAYNYAWGDSYSYHGSKYGASTFSVDSSGNFIFPNVSPIPFNIDFFFVKGVVFIILWFGLNFIGIIYATRFRHKDNWVLYHRIFSGGTASLTLIGSIVSIKLTPSTQKDSVTTAHDIMGFIILFLSAFQLAIGNFIYFKMTSPDLKTGWIHNFKKIHKFSAYFTIFLSFAEIGTAFGIRFSSAMGVFIALILLYFIAVTISNVLAEIKEKNKVLLVRELNAKKLNQKIEIYDAKKFKDLTEKSNLKIVLLDNFLVDISNYIEFHPGGQIHLLESLNNDISRYLDATSSINSKFCPHNHLYSTYRHIYEEMIIGLYFDDHKLVIQDSSIDKETSMINLQSFSNSSIDHLCEITSTREIAKNTNEFVFKIIDKKSGKLFTRFIQGYNWIGRHYAVSSVKQNKTRYYSISLCLDQLIYSKHLQLLENVKNLETNQPIEKISLLDSELRNDEIKFYVKKYNVNGLSQYLFDTKQPDDIFIKGPIGTGLNLNPDSLSGTFIAFGAGTGIFCFIDFVAFTLRYMCHIVAQKFNSNKPNQILDEDFSNVKGDFKLIYFSAFADRESVIFEDVCIKMKELNDKYKLGIFEFHSRISSETKQRWDAEYIKEKIGEENKISKVFLCGPTRFLDDIKGEILQLGIVTRDKIHMI